MQSPTAIWPATPPTDPFTFPARRLFVTPDAIALAAAQPVLDIELIDVSWDREVEASALQAIMARRRSIRRLHDGPFTPAMRAHLMEAVRLTPASYNLPPWRVVLVHERRDELWREIEWGFREHLSDDRLERYLDRLNGFRGGVAVALLFADRRVERALREEKGAPPEVAQTFVQQALGMVQLALWLAITAEGLATSLQHWDDLIGLRAARFAGLSEGDFALVATLPIGYAAEEPRTIERAAAAQMCMVDPGGHA
jgi:predicted oxidoreductase (fatty acid repression mutant protein)